MWRSPICAARCSSLATTDCASGGSATQMVKLRVTGVAVGGAVGVAAGIVVAVGAVIVVGVAVTVTVGVGVGVGAAHAVQINAATPISAAARAIEANTELSLQMGFEEPEVLVNRAGDFGQQIGGSLIAQISGGRNSLPGCMSIGSEAIG